MTVLVVVNHKLPNLETKTYNQDGDVGRLAEVFSNEKQKYKDSGKLLSENIDITEGGLNFKYSALWLSKEDYQEYLENTVLKQFWAERRKYNKANGITTTKSITEV